MCPACLLRLHGECFAPVDSEGCCCFMETEGTPAARIIGGGAGKADEDLRDVTSTGRKRAAQLKPIIEDMVCEWANLLYAGGGAVPIIGCDGVTLTKAKSNGERTGNIHHGPDKSTLNNSDPNLHRICGRCHNRWHALNDPHYGKERPPQGAEWIPINGNVRNHDKFTLATPEQVAHFTKWLTLSEAERQNTPMRLEVENA